MSDNDDFIPEVDIYLDEMEPLDKVPKGDKMALVKFDGTAITEQGAVVKHNWFKGIELDSNAYSDIVLTAKEARQLRTAHQRMKTGASASTILTCFGASVCPMARVCPYIAAQEQIDRSGEKRNVVPIGRRCHPPGTMIRVIGGDSIPIEDLDPSKHKVFTWYRKQNLVRSTKGSSFTLHNRRYQGNIISIMADDKEHKVTPEHISIARFTDKAASLFAIYLMRKDDMWRVGRTKLINRYNCPKSKVKSLFGPGQRAQKEGADELWVLGTCDTIAEAHLLEESFSIWIGASKAGFVDSLSKTDSKYDGFAKWVTMDQLEKHHRSLSKPPCHYANKLASIGLSIDAPFWSKSAPLMLGRASGISLSHPFAIYACNLMDDCMTTLVMDEEVNETHRNKYSTRWVSFKTAREEYSGMVYSLDVHINHTYIANEIVTHNCPIEVDLFSNALTKLADEFQIGDEAGDYTDQRFVMELAELEVLENRINSAMSSDPELQGLTEEKLISTVTTKDGGQQDNYLKDIADLLKIKEKIWARKDKIRRELVATRREARLVSAREGEKIRDASTVMAELNNRLTQVMALKKKMENI